jgi:hypothetical protein
MVLVTGKVTRKGHAPRQFVQSFFLARQETDSGEHPPTRLPLGKVSDVLMMPDYRGQPALFRAQRHLPDY